MSAGRVPADPPPKNIWCDARGLLGLEPIESGREAEDAHEGAGRLLIAGGNGAPLFQPRPEPLHVVAIVVDPLRAGDLVLVALGRDRRSRAQAPDVLAKGVAGMTPVRHHPFRHPRQALQERDRMGQFMRLTRRQDEGHRPSEPVGDHARLGPVAPTRAAQGFTLIARLAVGPLFSAPAAVWCARMRVPSRTVIPRWTPRSWARSRSRSQTPRWAQRRKVWAARDQGPRSAGMARPLAPF